jgi:hypothetical protein
MNLRKLYLCTSLTKGDLHNPERFIKGRPMVAMPPLSVAINPIVQSEDGSILDDRVNFPILTAKRYVK